MDGSSFSQNRHSDQESIAGWAFVVLAELPTNTTYRFRFCCATHGQLTTASTLITNSFDIGELLTDSLSAEAAAMIWTLAWICQNQHAEVFHIHYDNCTIGQYAEGTAKWNADWQYSKLRDAISGLRQCLYHSKKQLCFHHQKSHVQHPWSDLVDSIAKASAKGILHPQPLPAQVPSVLFSIWHGLHW